jgi:pyruvate dehydrogenase (quinone)
VRDNLAAGSALRLKAGYLEKARIIQVDAEATHLGQRHPVRLSVTGHTEATLESSAPRLQARDWFDFYDHVMAW